MSVTIELNQFCLIAGRLPLSAGVPVHTHLSLALSLPTGCRASRSWPARQPAPPAQI